MKKILLQKVNYFLKKVYTFDKNLEISNKNIF